MYINCIIPQILNNTYLLIRKNVENENVFKSKRKRGFRIIQNLYIKKDKLSFILNLKQKIYQKIIFFGNLEKFY